jgi:2-dehydrotetronate isomerase
MRGSIVPPMQKGSLRFCANISMLFTEVSFADRIGAAAKAGFSAVECQFPYEVPARDLRKRLDEAGLIMTGINAPPGEAGEFGFAALPTRQQDFRESLARALDYAHVLGAKSVHCLSGVLNGVPLEDARHCFIDNMAFACEEAERANVTLLVEPLNSYDRPDYFLTGSDMAADLIGHINRPELKIMFDIYHVQILEGDLLRRIGRHWPLIGHFQLASVPRRHEPDEGEINYAAILKEIAARGWQGWIGCEYRPRTSTTAGLGWIEKITP